MDLVTYLDNRDESQKAFAKRAGIAQSTLNGICLGAECHARTALKIKIATSGAVDVEDLVSEGGKRRGEKKSPIGRVDAPDGDELSSHEPSGGIPE